MSWNRTGSSGKDLLLRIAGPQFRDLALIAYSWRNILGALLAERSTPFKYEMGVLFVRVSNSTWLQELILMKDQLITKLNTLSISPIHEMVFVASEPQRKHRNRKAPADKK